MPTTEVPAGTLLAVDWGQRRIGIAYSVGSLAFPVETLPNDDIVFTRITQLVSDYRATGVILGLPLDLRGDAGLAAVSMQEIADALAQHINVPVIQVDERLTSALAHKQLAASGLRSRDRRVVIDQAAAVALLQHVLDSQATARSADDREG